MAEILPSDIGLATFEDVGDVQKLRTKAKNVVEAVNEIYETGGQGQELPSLGEQLYVEGTGNIIIGEGNTVYGNNNLIIGNHNVVIGDNHNIISSNKLVYNDYGYSYDYYEIDSNAITIFKGGGTVTNPKLSVGDKMVVVAYASWMSADYADVVYYYTEPKIVTISNIAGDKISFAEQIIENKAPDDIHTVFNYAYFTVAVPLTERWKLNNENATNILFGLEVGGSHSVSFNISSANAANAFSANNAKATGNCSAAFNSSKASGLYAFSANSGQALGDYSFAMNAATAANVPYSVAMGNNAKTYGRAFKCTEIDVQNDTVTVASGYNLSGLTGVRVVIRLKAEQTGNIVTKSTLVESVNGNTIQLKSGTFTKVTGYRELLYPETYMYVHDTMSSYGGCNMAHGYNAFAAQKYTLAYGYYVSAIHDGAKIFGKYGVSDSDYSLCMANGTSLSNLSLAFKVKYNGSVHADGEYTSPCADYSEYFEWADGNPDAEDRVGFFVKLDGGKIVKCSEFDTPLGIVSATPAIIGDSGEMHWHKKYLTDDFGRMKYHDVVVPEEKDEEGNVLIESHVESQPVINPEWDNTVEYIPRKDRKEWSTVGVLGKLIVYDDGTLKPGDICRPGNAGKAVKSVNNGYPVLQRVSDDKVLVWFKG